MGMFFCLMLAGAAAVAKGQGQDAQQQAGQVMPAAAEQLLAMANQARSENGAGPLRWDGALAEAARQHCLRMVAEGPIAHRYEGEPDVSERAGHAGARFSTVEENVAVGPTVASLHVGWMHSPGHRTNLLNPQVDHVGIAVVAVRGQFYAVADYARSVPQLSNSQIEARVAELIRPSGVAILNDPAVARAACAMEEGLPRATSEPQAQYVMRWQGADLTRLPQRLVDRLATGQYRQAAVGSCPAQLEEGTFTGFRLAVLLY